MKTCITCGQNQIFDKFYVKRTLPDGTKQYQSYCKSCAADRQRAYHLKKKGPPHEKLSEEELARRRKERKKRYRSSSEGKRKAAEYRNRNKAQIDEYNRQYRERNQEELRLKSQIYRDQHPERSKEYVQRWKAKNKPTIHISVIRQRAKALNAPGTFTKEDWLLVKARQNFTCLMCKKSEPDIKLTVDHIVPMILGGANSIENIQGLCRPCNSKKHLQILDLRENVE